MPAALARSGLDLSIGVFHSWRAVAAFSPGVCGFRKWNCLETLHGKCFMCSPALRTGKKSQGYLSCGLSVPRSAWVEEVGAVFKQRGSKRLSFGRNV